jgi:hypothetical protein
LLAVCKKSRNAILQQIQRANVYIADEIEALEWGGFDFAAKAQLLAEVCALPPEGLELSISDLGQRFPALLQLCGSSGGGWETVHKLTLDVSPIC